MNVNWIEPVNRAPTKEDITRFEIVYCKHCNKRGITCPVWNEMASAYRHQNKNDISPENIVRLVGRVNHVEVEPFFCRHFCSTRMLLYFALIESALQIEYNKEEPNLNESDN